MTPAAWSREAGSWLANSTKFLLFSIFSQCKNGKAAFEAAAAGHQLCLLWDSWLQCAVYFFTPLSTFSPYWALFTLLSTFHPTSTIHPTKHCRGKYFRNQGSKRELWLLLRWTPAHKKATELLKAGSYFIILSMMKADNMVSFSETFLSLQVVKWNLIQYYIGNIWN